MLFCCFFFFLTMTGSYIFCRGVSHTRNWTRLYVYFLSFTRDHQGRTVNNIRARWQCFHRHSEEKNRLDTYFFFTAVSDIGYFNFECSKKSPNIVFIRGFVFLLISGLHWLRRTKNTANTVLLLSPLFTLASYYLLDYNFSWYFS